MFKEAENGKKEINIERTEEAVAIANDSQYGLSGGVFSQDAGRAYNIARQLRTGGVLINGGGGRLNPTVPFGGYKRSGIGREFGEEGLAAYTEIKSISTPPGTGISRPSEAVASAA